MIFKVKHLTAIKAGAITLAFRRWTKPTIKAGSRLHTAMGVIEVTAMEKFSLRDLTPDLARKAGFDTVAALVDELGKAHAGVVYKISLRYQGEDPRIALRNKTDITAEELLIITQKLQRLDKSSKTGPWTSKVLLAIKDNPELRAVDLARKTGYEKEWLKINIRKLKNIGLTISHEVGYSISPLGTRYLKHAQ